MHGAHACINAMVAMHYIYSNRHSAFVIHCELYITIYIRMHARARAKPIYNQYSFAVVVHGADARFHRNAYNLVLVAAIAILYGTVSAKMSEFYNIIIL